LASTKFLYPFNFCPFLFTLIIIAPKTIPATQIPLFASLKGTILDYYSLNYDTCGFPKDLGLSEIQVFTEVEKMRGKGAFPKKAGPDFSFFGMFK
jgi:hypothetical protein